MEIKLTEEEIKLLKTYLEEFTKIQNTLGAMRQQYLASEKNLMEKIIKVETEYTNYAKFLGQNKGIEGEGWILDFDKWAFFKKEE